MNAHKTMINTFVMVSLMLFALEVCAFTHTEDAIETDSLRITLKDDGTGYIQGKICDKCKMLTVAITAATKAFNNNTEVPLKQAAGRAGKSATIFIDIEHTHVTRIVW
jgi:hypothetical protein